MSSEYWWLFICLLHEQPEVLCIPQCCNYMIHILLIFFMKSGWRRCEGVFLLEISWFNFMTVTVSSLMDDNYQQNITVVLDKYNLVHTKPRVITVIAYLAFWFTFFSLQVPAGTGMLKNHSRSDTFIRTSSHNQLLAEMMQSHMVKDMCLIGGKVRI